MKVTIIIECDEYNEICQHLDKIRKDMIKSIKKGTIESDSGDQFYDDNCYGEHSVEIDIDPID